MAKSMRKMLLLAKEALMCAELGNSAASDHSQNAKP